MKPTIAEVIGGYRCVFEAEEIVINVSRVHVHTDGKVTGEILLSTTKKGYAGGLYPPSSFNFSASRTRKELSNVLQEKYPEWNWSQLIDQLSYALIEMARIGEPVQELKTDSPVKPPQWLLRPLLFKGLPTIIFGEKAVAKSTLSMLLYLCLEMPNVRQFLDLGLETTNNPVKVLYCDWEVEADVAQWNARRLQVGMELTHLPVFYRRCHLPLADDIAQIQGHMNKLGAEALIIDSLGPAVGGDLKDAEQALHFTTALRQLKATPLIIGQTSKNQDGKKSVYGSTFFEYYARNIFELRKVQDEDADTIDIALFNTYCNLGKRQPPLGFQFAFSDDSITVGKRDARTVPEFVDRMGCDIRILQLLKSGDRAPMEIAKEINESIHTTVGTLSRLVNKGLVTKVNGQYGLPLPSMLDEE